MTQTTKQDYIDAIKYLPFSSLAKVVGVSQSTLKTITRDKEKFNPGNQILWGIASKIAGIDYDQVNLELVEQKQFRALLTDIKEAISIRREHEISKLLKNNPLMHWSLTDIHQATKVGKRTIQYWFEQDRKIQINTLNQVVDSLLDNNGKPFYTHESALSWIQERRKNTLRIRQLKKIFHEYLVSEK